MSEKINLDNCDFTLKGKRLNSPRSLEAIKIIGADENDLIKLTLAQYLKKFPEARGIKKELQDERFEHYEEQRQKLLDEIKKVRNELVQNDNDNNKSTAQNNNTTNDINKIIDNNENNNNDVFVDKEEVEEDNLRKNKPEEEKKKEEEKKEEKKDENEEKKENENEEKKDENKEETNENKEETNKSKINNSTMKSTKEEPTAIIEARKKLEKERQIQENNLKMMIEYEYDLDIARQENLKKLEEEKKKEEELKREK